ncbi:MOP flippase family protein [Luteimonas arsenica]|uniref:MOP flippase family protein n=1 Tax=Luteimonas arsenica TaxID=1586242 RepID=UPI001055E161|nr:MOP flippase family protein [Luteimonas arsenica]
MNLRRRAFSAVRWTTLGMASKAVLQVAQVAVLARLLLPADYGLMAMATVIIGLARVFADFGLNSAFLQRRDVTENQRSSLFWLNMLLSVGLMLLVVAGSPLFARFYSEPRVAPLIALASLAFPVSALGQQVRVAAEKALAFQKVMLIEMVAALSGFLVAVLAALEGWGVYALIAGSLCGAAITTGLNWILLSNGWRPAIRMRVDEVRSFLGFGGALVASNLVNYLNSAIDLILGGRLLAATHLGLYSVPRNLTLQVQFVVNPIISRVAFPLMAEVQNDLARVRSVYLQTLKMTASINAPAYLTICFFAPEVIHIVLGPKWESAADILRILAIWGAIRSTANPVGSLLLGVGRADLAFKWNLALLGVVPPIVWVGSKFGTEGIAASLLCAQLLLFVPNWYFLVRKACGATLLEYINACVRPFLLAVLAVSGGYFAAHGISNPLWRLAAGIGVAGPAYIGISWFANHDWLRAVMELLGLRMNRSISE